MKNVKILIVEDDFSFTITLEMMLGQLGYQNINTAENATQAFEHIKQQCPDLILMDIQLNGKLTGIDIANKIKSQNIPIIFLTAYLDESYFQKAKEALPYAYLNKPFNETTLKRTIQLVIAQIMDKTNEKHTFIRQAGKMEKVNYGDVLWVKADGNYCYLITDEKKYALKISLIKMMKKLPEGMFIRSHRNILVQINKVQQVDLADNKILLKHICLPIGSTFRKGILKQFKEL